VGTVRNVTQYAGYNAGARAFNRAEGAAQAHLDDTVGPIPGTITEAAWGVASVLAALGFLLSIGMLATPALLFVGPRRGRVAAAALIVVWGGIALGGSLTSFVEVRNAAPIAPLQWMLEAATAVLLVTVAVDLLRRRRGAPGTD
jgi:hypothetical protein